MKRALLVATSASVYLLAGRGRLLRLGATEDEARRSLPGDTLVTAPTVDSTMAITIAAPPSAVWPWLVQMGCDRGGWYGIDLLDNGGRPSAREIHPEWQSLAPGDRLAMTPGARQWFEVAELEPERALVLAWEGSFAGLTLMTSWALVLEEEAPGTTRLLARARAAGEPRWALSLGAVALGEPGHVLVQRRQLVNLKRRAESR